MPTEFLSQDNISSGETTEITATQCGEKARNASKANNATRARRAHC